MFKNKVIRTDDTRVFEVIPVKKKKEVSSSQSSTGEGGLTSWRPGTEGSLYPSELRETCGSSWPGSLALPAPNDPRNGDQESPRTSRLFPEILRMSGGSQMLIA